MKKYIVSICVFFLLHGAVSAQILDNKAAIFTKQDSLRGSITKERAWWNLTYYHLDIKVNPEAKTIIGSNTIRYTVLESYNRMQIDLQNPMEIYKVIQDGKELNFSRESNVFYLDIVAPQIIGESKELTIFYGGKPKIAIKPPWDGGITWTTDSNGKPFIASTCQGLGASVWWPNKDHMYDEVNSMLISVTVPENLTDVSNGRLQSVVDLKDGTKTFNWFVTNPINNYGVNINIGDYVSFSEEFKGEKGNLDCTYYVLKDNLNKAQVHFKEAPRMLKAFEHWFGPYPFYEDSYKLVEAPYLGMEHQSSITYGNKYGNGYLGNDLSGTSWGLKFDYIIVHESGHEWFANNITYKDIADMWIHESFTCYAENLFVEYYYGKKAGSEYVRGLRKGIDNDKPLIGIYNVNHEGSSDMYNKGANMIHTLRQIVNNDKKWRTILRGLNRVFYHQTVTTKQIEDYLAQSIGIDLTTFFNQYLRETTIPVLEYKFKDNQISYRWTNSISDFSIPVKVTLNGKEKWLKPTTEWITNRLKSKELDFVVNSDFYVGVLKSVE